MLTLWFIGNMASATDWDVGDNSSYATINEVLPLVQPGDTILLEPGDFVENVLLLDRMELTIRGAGTGPTGSVLAYGGGSGDDDDDDNDVTSVLSVRSSTALTIEDLEIVGGANVRPASITNGSTNVVLRNVLLTGGDQGQGGGLLVDGGSVAIVENATISGNAAVADGGGIYINSGSLSVHHTTLLNNSATTGGNLFCGGSAVCLVEDSVFVGGTAASGGGMLVSAADATVIRSRFCANEANVSPLLAGDGGAIAFTSATGSLRNNLFYDNAAVDNGGALWVRSSPVVLTNNTFLNNQTADRGSAVFLLFGESTGELVNNLFANQQNSNNNSDNSAAVVGASVDPTGSYNLFFNNQPADAVPGRGFTDSIFEDPQLTFDDASDCASLNIVPTLGGPTTDAGSPTILDPGGSVSDIGATGGPDVIRDQDGDGFIEGLGEGLDCEDLLFDVNPDSVEVCNGIDDDCDGLPDLADSSLDPAQILEVWNDEDEDGWGTGDSRVACEVQPRFAVRAGDCQDDNAAVNPGAEEACNDGLDNNCNEQIDEGCAPGGLADPNVPDGAFFGGGRCSTGFATWEAVASLIQTLRRRS